VSGPKLRWHTFPGAEQVVAAVVATLADRAAHAIGDRGAFLIVLSGGSTPRPIYAAARGLDTDWSRWQVYFSDERCLAPADPGRNDTMARAAWLEHVPIPLEQIHSIPAELGPDAGAAAYRQTLERVGLFDLVLLGLGEDGHTASLFAGRPAGSAPGSADVLAVHGAPKPPTERVSLSAARLARAGAVTLVVLGASKRSALAKLRSAVSGPVSAIVPRDGIDVFADTRAAGPG
jgi:6-phosphogluconolactonase